ncbi:MAG: GNAT family N-acetyltransferase [Gemmatimonadaceae bacterium]|jgi:GNAT superfamily N-acetyltransferase|nr:GNAT family N-acetyltransferase [Gemmatimonadaceae bacterium]
MPERPSGPMITVRRARAADAAALSHLAAETFRDAFADQNTAEDMAAHLAAHYSPPRQAAEIADPASTVLLAEHTDERGTATLIGYAHVASTQAPAVVTGSAPIELKRFYVARAHHGAGVAHRLFDAVEAEARRRGADALWLGVFTRNPRAIAFYAKRGLAVVGEQIFTVGTDPQRDWIMARALAAPDAPSDP